MHWLYVWFYRFIDQQLNRPVCLGDPGELDRGEWNQRVGDLGEVLACKSLWARGKKVLYRQFTAPGGGEIDIVARDGEILVFCEVKTRTSKKFGRPADAVDYKKRRLITRGANAWIQELGFVPAVFRFDIIEVILLEGELPEVKIIENAFQAAPRLLA